jgi:hypothetical protein
MNNNNNNTQTNEKKTYFFSERVIVRSKGIVASSFGEAEKQYLDQWVKNVKFGNFDVDSGDYEVFTVDKDGKEEKVY